MIALPKALFARFVVVSGSFVVLGAAACSPRTVAPDVSPTFGPAQAPASEAVAAGVYGPPSEADLAKLTRLQREVTQHAGTEPPFQNAYWDNHAVGLYVDVVTGEPLFSSRVRPLPAGSFPVVSASAMVASSRLVSPRR